MFKFLMCRYLAFRARGGNHCHLNFIGISKSQAAAAKQVLLEAAALNNFGFDSLDAASGAAGQRALQERVGNGQYFQAFLPDGSRLVHAIPRCVQCLAHASMCSINALASQSLIASSAVPTCHDGRHVGGLCGLRYVNHYRAVSH